MFWHWRSWLAAAVPVGLVLLWLRPLVDEKVSHNPSASERARGVADYGQQLVVSSDRHFRSRRRCWAAAARWRSRR